jgi:thioredoxin 1
MGIIDMKGELTMSVLTITSENFEAEVLKSDKPVLIDFWASWCGPCRMLSPVVDQVAEEVTTVKVGKINVDEEGDLAKQFGIMSIPTLLLFKNGEVVATSVGVKPKAEIKAMIEG